MGEYMELEEDLDIVELPNLEEARDSLKALRNNKSPGADNLPAELPKYGGNEVMKIHDLITLAWEKERIPKEWRKSVIFPIHKKEIKLVCTSYKGITLLCITYKVFTKIVRHKLQPHMQNTLGECQGGFRSGRSITGQLFTIKQILEKS
jgi:hypothetical protein